MKSLPLVLALATATACASAPHRDTTVRVDDGSPAPAASASPAPASDVPSSAPPDTTTAASASPSSPPPSNGIAADTVALGFLFDPSMSHTVVGVFAWHGETRLPVVVAGRILGACSTDTYPTIVTAARAREVVLGLGCDGRGVAANALSVVEVVRHGDEVIVRTGALRRPRARITAVHEMGRIALGGASNVRAASAAETQVARDTITNWYGSP